MTKKLKKLLYEFYVVNKNLDEAKKRSCHRYGRICHSKRSKRKKREVISYALNVKPSLWDICLFGCTIYERKIKKGFFIKKPIRRGKSSI